MRTFQDVSIDFSDHDKSLGFFVNQKGRGGINRDQALEVYYRQKRCSCSMLILSGFVTEQQVLQFLKYCYPDFHCSLPPEDTDFKMMNLFPVPFLIDIQSVPIKLSQHEIRFMSHKPYTDEERINILERLQAWAKVKKKFKQFLEDNDIDFDSFTPQNVTNFIAPQHSIAQYLINHCARGWYGDDWWFRRVWQRSATEKDPPPAGLRPHFNWWLNRKLHQFF